MTGSATSDLNPADGIDTCNTSLYECKSILAGYPTTRLISYWSTGNLFAAYGHTNIIRARYTGTETGRSDLLLTHEAADFRPGQVSFGDDCRSAKLVNASHTVRITDGPWNLTGFAGLVAPFDAPVPPAMDVVLERTGKYKLGGTVPSEGQSRGLNLVPVSFAVSADVLHLGGDYIGPLDSQRTVVWGLSSTIGWIPHAPPDPNPDARPDFRDRDAELIGTSEFSTGPGQEPVALMNTLSFSFLYSSC